MPAILGLAAVVLLAAGLAWLSMTAIAPPRGVVGLADPPRLRPAWVSAVGWIGLIAALAIATGAALLLSSLFTDGFH